MRSFLLFGLFMICMAPAVSQAQRSSSGSAAKAAHKQAVEFFPYWVDGSTPQSHDNTMRELISLDSPARNWPAFPRTWLELSLERTQTTTSGWAASVSAFQNTIPVISSVVNIGARADYKRQYRYNVSTTFVAISSLRPLQPEATKNSEQSFAPLPANTSSDNRLRSIVDFDPVDDRAYFKVDKQHPIMGLCKFEMSLRIAKTESNTLEFLVAQRTNENEVAFGTTFALYSNFFEVKNDIPIQEYLRTTCDKEFQYLVRYLADDTFDKVVKDTFANYHPQAPCVRPSSRQPLDPRGDKSCMAWFYKSSNLLGGYRRDNVPRCELGYEGIPVCVLRSKEGGSCPVYYSDGKISDQPALEGKAKLVTVGNHTHFSCDKGLSCKPRSGGEWKNERVGWYTPFTGVEATCQK